METDALEWAKLDELTTHLSDLQVRLDLVRALKNLGVMKMIEREIAETASERNRLVGLLCSRLADQVTASLAASPMAA